MERHPLIGKSCSSGWEILVQVQVLYVPAEVLDILPTILALLGWRRFSRLSSSVEPRCRSSPVGSLPVGSLPEGQPIVDHRQPGHSSRSLSGGRSADSRLETGGKSQWSTIDSDRSTRARCRSLDARWRCLLCLSVNQCILVLPR